MYVIFPADEVVSLTYGRVIIPRTSKSRTPSTPIRSERTSFDSYQPQDRSYTNNPTVRVQSVNNPYDTTGIESTSFNGSDRNSLYNGTGDSPSTSLSDPAVGRSISFKETDNSALQREKSTNRSFFKREFSLSVKRERSPAASRPSTLGPDPRLQLTNLQHTPPEKSPVKKKSFFGTKAKKQVEVNMAAAGSESTLRELAHPSFNEAMKSHNAVTFKLVRTVSDFTQQLSQIYEQHAEELQMLVSNFRKRNGELRKERPACPSSLFHTWETLLQEVEIDSQAHSDIASILGRQVSRPLLEKSFHRKIQSRKVFTHRESYDTIITKTEEKLVKCRQDYKNAYLSYLSVPTTQSLSAYFDSHNAYVQQLHATNGMLDEYGKETLPQLLQELEEIYSDLCSTLSESVLQGAEVVSARAMEQYKRYEGLSSQCKAVSGATDLAHFTRSLPQPPHNRYMMKRLFCPPQPPVPDPDAQDGDKNTDIQNENIPPPLKDELVVDRLASIQVKPSHDALRKEAADLEIQIKQIQDALDTLVRIQQRSLESNLFNKVNEIQEDISMKRFDLRVAQIHLSAINSQKELFSNKLEQSTDTGRERKMSAASTGSMKSKWLKAFKSLKTPPSSGASSPREVDKKNQMYHAVSTIIAMRKNGAAGGRDIARAGESEVHNFQEYTYKKITPCDICSQVLRGHTRQGLKCRICKMNVHVDCQDKVGKCQSKSRLLRRQKSTSEIETKVPEATVEEESQEDMYYGMSTLNRQISFKDTIRPQSLDIESPEVDLIYQVLKQAGEISNTKPRSGAETGINSGRGMLIGVENAPSTRVEERPPVGILVNDRSGASSAPGSSGSSGQSLNRRGQPNRPPGSSLTVSNPVPHSTSSERGSTPGTGTRPFGQPLCLTVTQENGNDRDLPPTPPPPSPSIFKNKQQPSKKVVKAKK